jgi:hypothetical protein
MSRQVKIQGSEGGWLILTQGDDGDVWVNINSVFDKANTLRFCTMTGGGKTPKVRKALNDLVEAMIEDGGKSNR